VRTSALQGYPVNSSFADKISRILPHRHPFRKRFDPQPPTGGVPCPGSGGRWGRNLRHGESQSRFRPQQICPPAKRSLFLSRGYGGGTPPCLRFLFFPKPNRRTHPRRPQTSQNTRQLFSLTLRLVEKCLKINFRILNPHSKKKETLPPWQGRVSGVSRPKLEPGPKLLR
jgi:hypothetical protein